MSKRGLLLFYCIWNWKIKIKKRKKETKVCW